jgi:hypothetical protein
MCNSQYINPCFLPCQHIFCSACIKIATTFSKEGPPLRCPVCLESAYVDENTAHELKPFEYDPSPMAGANTGLEKTLNEEIAKVPKCKGRKCQKDATHYCENCGEKGIYCEAHGELHLESLEDHTIK